METWKAHFYIEGVFMSINKASELVLGNTKPTPVTNETIEVEVSSENLFGDFAKAFIHEASRVAPLRFDRVGLTEDEVKDYIYFIMRQRINYINMSDSLPGYKCKLLCMPSWIQYIITMVGRVDMRDIGLTIIPKMSEYQPISSDGSPRQNLCSNYDQALVISTKIESFSDDLQIVKDAFPREIEGDRDVMSTAMIDEYVRAMKPVQHVASTYVAAYAGLKLREEAAFKVLYRVAYDDLSFIRSALMSTKSIFH